MLLAIMIMFYGLGLVGDEPPVRPYIFMAGGTLFSLIEIRLLLHTMKH